MPTATKQTLEQFNAQEPCPECGQRPGYNPATGVEVKDGHRYDCKLHNMTPEQRKQQLYAAHLAEVLADKKRAEMEKDLAAAEERSAAAKRKEAEKELAAAAAAEKQAKK